VFDEGDAQVNFSIITMHILPDQIEFDASESTNFGNTLDLGAQTLQVGSSQIGRYQTRPTKFSVIDGLNRIGLTIEAFRVAVNLICAAQVQWIEDKFIFVAKFGMARIGRACFSQSYPNSGDSVIRRKVFNAIAELEKYGILSRDRHIPGETLCNTYYIDPNLEAWTNPQLTSQENPNIRKGRSRKTTQNVDPTQIQPDLTFVANPEDLTRSSQDHGNKYINNTTGSSNTIPSGERENINARARTSPDETTAADTSSDQTMQRQPLSAPLQTHSVRPNTTGQDSVSPVGKSARKAALLSVDNYHDFAYQTFIPTDNPDYWQWARSHVVSMQQRRIQTNHPSPIDNVESFTLACIGKRGADGFERYAQAVGLLPCATQPAAYTKTYTNNPGKSSSDAQEALELEQWQQASSTLNNMFEQGRVEDVLDCLRRSLQGGSGFSPSPQKVAWLCAENPHWGINYTQGVLERGTS
jgi:hypothetical protein